MSNQRPPEDDMSGCCLPLQQLVKQSWQKNVEARPRMKEIVDSLVTLANNIKNAYCKQISDENPAEESFSLIEKQTIQKKKSNKCKQKGNQRQMTMLGQNSSNVEGGSSKVLKRRRERGYDGLRRKKLKIENCVEPVIINAESHVHEHTEEDVWDLTNVSDVCEDVDGLLIHPGCLARTSSLVKYEVTVPQ